VEKKKQEEKEAAEKNHAAFLDKITEEKYKDKLLKGELADYI